MNKPDTVAVPINISHLGVSFGNESNGRIIALPTSEVFYNKKLISSLLHVPPSSLDNGFQAHLYSDTSDTLVVYIQDVDELLIRQTANNISVNADIWKTLTGISLATDNVVIASNSKKTFPGSFPKGINLREGTLIKVAVRIAGEERKAISAFVYNEHFLEESGLNFPKNSLLRKYAETTSLLMDKNKTIQLLQKNNVPVPFTWFSGKQQYLVNKASKYVFKPSGGAAGLGLYSNEGKGASLDDLKKYIKNLEETHLLPADYQIQEFIPGPVYGALVLFHSEGAPEILQIHNQIINQKSRFIAGCWSREIQSQRSDAVSELVRKITAIEELKFIGLMGIDIIDDKIIEINPRITASSPVSHLLFKEKEIQSFVDSEFRIDRIDINVGVPISKEMINSGQLKKNILEMWLKHKVMILPQGLNPVGNSRVLFINDDQDNRVQTEFLKRIET